MLAWLTQDYGQAASLFVRAVGLGARAGDAEGVVEDTLRSVKSYCGRLSVEAAKLVLQRVRQAVGVGAGWLSASLAGPSVLALEGLGPDKLQSIKQEYNALGVDLMDLNGALDADACEGMASQLLRDGDVGALVSLVQSATLKYSQWVQPGTALPLRILRVARDTSRVARHNATLLSCQGRLALLMVCVNPYAVDAVEEEVAEGVLAWAQVDTSTARSELLAFGVRLLKAFFELTLFLENPYRVRNSCALGSFVPDRVPHHLGWDAELGRWLELSELTPRLQSKLEACCRLSVACLEASLPQDLNHVCLSLTLPMLAAMLQHGTPSPALVRQLGLSFTALDVEPGFGLTPDNLQLVADCCPSACCLSCAEGLDCAPLLRVLAPRLHSLQRLDLSRPRTLQPLPVAMLLEQNPGLQWLSLGPMEPSSDVPFSLASLTSLREVHLSPKLHPAVLYEVLSSCSNLSTLVYRKGKKPFVVSRTVMREGQESLAMCWGRSINVLLKKNAVCRDIAKAFYRGYLESDPEALKVLLGSLFLPTGQINGSLVTVLRKAGQPLISKAIAQYIANGDYDTVFQLLTSIDKLETYDATSVLGAVVHELRQQLLRASFPHFPRYLKILGPSRLVGLMASLPTDLIQSITHYFLRNDMVFVEHWYDLLQRHSHNEGTILASSIILTTRLASEPPYVQRIQEQLETLLLSMREPNDQPIRAHLLMMALRCDRAMVEQCKGWPLVRHFNICHVVGLMDPLLLLHLIKMLPPSLLSFSIQYSSGVRDVLSCVDDHVLEALSNKFCKLECLVLDLCPLVTNHGLQQVAKHCALLKHVQIRAPAVSDDGVGALVDGCPLIKVLKLQCAVRDVMLSRLGSQFGNLLQVEFFECPIVTLHGLEKLAANSSTVRCLRVQNCRNVRVDLVQIKSFVRTLTSHIKAGDSQGVFETKTTIERKV